MNALSKLFAKEPRLVSLPHGTEEDEKAGGGQLHVWDGAAGILLAAPNWDAIGFFISAVEEARADNSTGQLP